MMILSIAERKHRMPYGGQKEVADELGISKSTVSLVMAGKARTPETDAAKLELRRIQEACARKLGVPFEVAFPEAVETTQVG